MDDELKERIKALAVEAGFGIGHSEAAGQLFERFAQAVARECVGVSEEIARRKEDDGVFLWEARNCAQAIRARFGLGVPGRPRKLYAHRVRRA